MAIKVVNCIFNIFDKITSVLWQVWDTELERSAEHWAHTCLWEHGPAHLLTRIGQNLGAHWGRLKKYFWMLSLILFRDLTIWNTSDQFPLCMFTNALPVCWLLLFSNVFRDRPPTFHVQAWYDEVRDFSYPYPQECDPYCPYRCSGPVCTHYTQVTSPAQPNSTSK